MERQNLNTTSVYVLSILGFLCCCSGLGIIPSAIAYYIANKKLKEAALNPDLYDNISGMKTAKTVALVVIIICVISFIYTIFQIATIGWSELLEQNRLMLEELNVN